MAERYNRRPDGTTGSIPHDVIVRFNYDVAANAVDNWVFYADTHYEVVGVFVVPAVAGSDGSAVTADIMKASGTTAVASGATVLSAADSFNLKGTAHTLQSGTLSATLSARQLTTGDRLGINFTGTMTAAVGYIQVNSKRLQTANGSR